LSFRILIVDDHEIVRKGVRTVLQTRPEWDVCGEAVNGQEAVELAKQLRPDAIIMDVTMPVMGGLDAAREICKLGLGSKILIFTMHEAGNLSEVARKAGAHGFVFKSRATADLLIALEKLFGGGTFFGSEPKGNLTPPKSEPPRNLSFRLALNWVCDFYLAVFAARSA